MTQHTPTYDTIYQALGAYPLFRLEEMAKDFYLKHDPEITQEDLAEQCAALIVKAVNSHEALVAAALLFSNAREAGEIEAALEATRAALKLAKGEA